MKNLNFKEIHLVVIVFILTSNIAIAQLGVGTTTPNSSAMLDVESTTKGFLPPRMTVTQRDAINSPASGLLVLNTTSNQLNYYNGSSWQIIETDFGNYVDLTSDQSNIAGDKTFTGMLTVAGRLMLPMGEISYFKTSGFNITVPLKATGVSDLGTNDNMVKINPGTADTEFVNDVFGTGTDSRLTYTGIVGRYFHIALSFSYQPETDKDQFLFGVARNGLVEDSSKLFITTGAKAEYQSTAMHVLLWLEPNEYLEFFVGNLTRTNNYIKMKSFNFVAIGM